jgi:type I restriction enzyme M protein
LGLIFLKNISDILVKLYGKLKDDKLSDTKDKNEYLAENVFYVTLSALWNYLLQQKSKLSTNGKGIDNTINVIDKDNPALLRSTT